MLPLPTTRIGTSVFSANTNAKYPLPTTKAINKIAAKVLKDSRFQSRLTSVDAHVLPIHQRCFF
jgi:hypothetical protein